MDIGRLLGAFILLVSLPSIFAASYYYKIINPNDYAVTDYQLKIDLNSVNPSLVGQPIAQIYDVTNNQPLNFCYEQSNLECSNVVSDTGYIWVKIDSIPAKDYIVIRIDSDGSTNGATTGDNVFDFYDDFNDGDVNGWEVWGPNPAVESGVVHFSADGDHGIRREMSFDLDNIYYEVKWMVTGGQIDLIFRDQDGGNENRYQFTYEKWNGANDRFLAKLVSGNFIKVRSFEVGWSYNTWYISSIKIHGYDYCLSDSDGTFCATDTQYPATSSNRWIDVGNWWGTNTVRDTYIDFVRIRKYIDQELVLQSAYSQSSLSPQTATSQSTTFEQTYDYVKIKYVAGLNPTIIENIAIPIVIDTQKWINEGKLQSDCSDLYVTYYDPVDGTEKPAPYFIDKQTCNTPQTIVYVKLPQIASDKDTTLFIYHGVPGTALPYEDPKNTFYFFVDLSNPTDVNNNLDIFTSGTASYEITSSGIHVTTGSDGYVAIYNK